MKISLGTWAFTFGPWASHPVPLKDIAKRAAKAGYEGLELSGFPPHVTLDRYPDRALRQALRDHLGELNLGLSGYSADLSLYNPVLQENREPYLALFRRVVDLCADLGAPMVRVDTGTAPGSMSDAEIDSAFRHLARLWAEAARVAEGSGIKVCWEFEPGFAFNKPSEVVRLHDAVNHQNFRILFDTAHAYMSSVIGARQHGLRETLPGGVAELLQRLKPRIGAIHMIDSDGTLAGDETSTHCPFGQGRVDFAALAPLLKDIGGVDYWCIDLSFWAGSWDLVETSVEFVRPLAE